jgi:uncharacterized ferritin-like protein (DUF455 family)
MDTSTPAVGTVERWAWDYVSATTLEEKQGPRPAPSVWEEGPPARRSLRPGRPPALMVRGKARKVRGTATATSRARVLHTFLHHELQAAELMAWAILAFPDAPQAFRRGLLRIAEDEIRHMGMYARHIETLGHRVGDFEVRDWFWERVPSCTSPESFVATMGLGLESANLEHARTFAARFRAAGDEAAARLQESIGEEEIGHVRFGAKWFGELTGGLSFGAWKAYLPPPLSPLLMRGRPLHREARLRAGFGEAFLDELDAWAPE